MDQVVHADKPAGGGNVVGIRIPGVEQDGNMVVPVEEDEWLLPQDNEYCVAQLRDLAQGKHPVPETSHSVVQETEKSMSEISETFLLLSTLCANLLL